MSQLMHIENSCIQGITKQVINMEFKRIVNYNATEISNYTYSKVKLFYIHASSLYKISFVSDMRIHALK